MERDYTNMLIIGNGFDLAHERPTTYSNFLLFLELILEIRNYNRDKKYVEEYLDNEYDKLCPTVKEYLLSSFDTRLTTENGYTRNTNIMVQELYNRLDKNAWYEYLQRIHQENEIHGKNWIDIEGEIREVIEFFDREIEDIYEQWSGSPSSLPKSSNQNCLFHPVFGFL